VTTYIVATTTPPTIVCPPWCVMSESEHIDELPDWDGCVLHRSGNRGIAPDSQARAYLAATPDGTPEGDNPLTIHLGETPEAMTPTQTAQLCAGLAAFTDEINQGVDSIADGASKLAS
jgi:hypothetical protein